LIHQPAELRRVGDVGDDAERIPAGVPDRIDRGLRIDDVANRNACALGGQGLRKRPSEPAAGSGDDCDFPIEPRQAKALPACSSL
jgi:hypothetical protein